MPVWYTNLLTALQKSSDKLHGSHNFVVWGSDWFLDTSIDLDNYNCIHKTNSVPDHTHQIASPRFVFGFAFQFPLFPSVSVPPVVTYYPPGD